MDISAPQGNQVSDNTNKDLPLADAVTAGAMAPPFHHRMIDITPDICPMTFVRTRLALDRMQPGEILLVRMKGAEPAANVPRNAEAQGHAVLATLTDSAGITQLWLRRK